jgi:mannose-6-phosphate isomerase-like protein (cupin superfamily)
MSGGSVERGRYPMPVDRGQVAQSWGERGYDCHRMTDRPGQVWADFVHDVDELVVVQSGKLEVIIDGQSFDAEPGDEVFIPKRAVHTVRNIADENTCWIFGYA